MMEHNEMYMPEGYRINTTNNREAVASIDALNKAKDQGTILEAMAVRCDADYNLYVKLPIGEGVIPHAEGACGIAEGTVRDVALVSRVGRPVCFVVTGFETFKGTIRPILSRRIAQERCKENYINHLKPGDVIPARVSTMATFGAFCDIGCGLIALLPISHIACSRIEHPSELLSVGADIYVVISARDNDRITVSHRELLGTWEENAALFHEGETVIGTVRGITSYGCFIELTPNLCGLAETDERVHIGQQVSVYIKSFNPEKRKVKLAISHIFNDKVPAEPMKYFITSGTLTYWRYTPEECDHTIESYFGRDEE